MTEQSADGAARYRIGAVARMTGISPDTLRIWERRYAAVTPQRSASGGRLYSSRDVERLRCMKQLVDAGDTIGEVAHLEIDALRDRIAATQPPAPRTGTPQDFAPCRVLVVGEALAGIIRQAGDTLSGITLAGSYIDVRDFETRSTDVEAEVLLVEQTSLHEDSAARVLDWLARSRIAHALVVYRYASAEALRRLPASQCSALRAPVDARSLEAHCLHAQHATPRPAVPAAAEGASVLQPAPARRYHDDMLARLATLSPTVKCECPRHLAELIAGLSAFERYSSECESRNPGDAALHAFLHASTSHARHIIEDALDQVIAVEGIEL